MAQAIIKVIAKLVIEICDKNFHNLIRAKVENGKYI